MTHFRAICTVLVEDCSDEGNKATSDPSDGARVTQLSRCCVESHQKIRIDCAHDARLRSLPRVTSSSGSKRDLLFNYLPSQSWWSPWIRFESMPTQAIVFAQSYLIVVSINLHLYQPGVQICLYTKYVDTFYHKRDGFGFDLQFVFNLSSDINEVT